jgi:dTDP-4-amino-4,6-dideoxygalactose transaminase
MSSEELDAFRRAIAGYLDLSPDRVTLWWKGRVALYSILEAAGITSGEVVVPAFTCVVVPNAILYAGAKPVYAEIEPETYHLDLGKLESRLTPRTRAILAQNTFGLAPPIDELRDLARRRGLLLIEDCAHGFGGSYRDHKNGTLADASFFSTQWNKPFSTGLGGIAVATDDRIAARLREIEARSESAERREQRVLRFLIQLRKAFPRPETFALAAAGYRALSKAGVVLGSSDPSEVAGTSKPEKFLKAMSAVQARAGRREIDRLDAYNAHRRSIAAIYDEELARMGLARPVAPAHARHTYLKYPIVVGDRDLLLARAAAKGIALSDWFRSPIHPVRDGWERWLYQAGSNPAAEDLARHMVNLPTQPGVTPRYARRVLRFLVGELRRHPERFAATPKTAASR